jgi:cytochrome c2
LKSAQVENEDGNALRKKSCGRCHAVLDGAASQLKGAPNLWTILRSYADERSVGVPAGAI